MFHRIESQADATSLVPLSGLQSSHIPRDAKVGCPTRDEIVIYGPGVMSSIQLESCPAPKPQIELSTEPENVRGDVRRVTPVVSPSPTLTPGTGRMRTQIRSSGVVRAQLRNSGLGSDDQQLPISRGHRNSTIVNENGKSQGLEPQKVTRAVE